MAKVPSINELLLRLPSESLDRICSEEHLLKLTDHFSEWINIATYLRLTAVQQRDIEIAWPHDPQRQRTQMFRKWKMNVADKATYRSLIQSFYDAGRVDLINDLCEIVDGDKSSSEQSNDDMVTSEHGTSVSELVTSTSGKAGTEPSPLNDDHTVPTLESSVPATNELQDDTQSEAVSCDLPDSQPKGDELSSESSESQSSEERSDLEARIDQLEEEYRTLGEELINSLEENKISVKQLQSYAATLPSKVCRYYEELKSNELYDEIKVATCINDFTVALNKFSNFLNPALLNDAIKKFGDKQTKKNMRDYNKKLEEFQSSTTLVQFVMARTWEGEKPEGYAEIELVLKTDWEHKTFKDITPPRRSWLFRKVYFGSLRVIFSIPDISELEEESVEEFLRIHAAKVLVNGQCVRTFEADEDEPSVQNSRLPPNSEMATSLSDSSTRENVSNISEVKDCQAISTAGTDNQTTSGRTALEIVRTSTLPEFQFSSFSYGKNVVLSEDGLEAHRRDLDNEGDAGVYIATPLRGLFEFEVEITASDSDKYGSLDIGIVQCTGGTYRHLDIPNMIGTNRTKDMCTWYGDTVYNDLSGEDIKKKYGSVNLFDLKQGHRIGLSLSENGDLHFSANGVDQGLAATNVYSKDKDIYAAVSVSGRCTALRITRAAMSGYEHPAEGHKGQMDAPDQTTPPDSIEFTFHPVAGENIMLLEDGLYARRIDPDNKSEDAVVYGSQPIPCRGRCNFEVEVIEYNDSKWRSMLQVGVMRRPTGTNWNQSDIPGLSEYGDNHCVWTGSEVLNWLSGNLIKSDYGSVNLDKDLGQGDRVGLRLSSDGSLTFFVNGRSQGVAATNVHQPGFDVYPVVDVTCKCYVVRITRAEIQSEVLDLQELCVERITSCLDWSSKDVNLLPLPQKLKNKVERYIDHL